MFDMLRLRSAAEPGGIAAGTVCADRPPRPRAAQEPAAGPASLDAGVLASLERLERRLGKRVLPGMLDVLERHLPRGCLEMWRALAERDAETVRQVSHRLKSSARCLGMLRLGEICARLERESKEGRLGGAERSLEAIEREYARAAAALRRHLAASPPEAPGSR